MVLVWIGACAISGASVASAPSTDLRQGFGPARAQGERNTCSAFAATALAEYLVRERTGRQVDLSESYTYWAGKTLGPSNELERSSYEHIDGLAGFLAVAGLSGGVLAENAWPYSPSLPACGEGAPLECFTGTPPANVQEELLPYRLATDWIERERIAEFLTTEKRPVLMNINFYPSLFDPRGDLKRMPTQAESAACAQGQGCGGHVVLIVGYDAATGRYAFRNSWGPGWGDQGYGTLPERFVVEQCELCRQLPNAGSLDAAKREFLMKAVRGVSAHLAP